MEVITIESQAYQQLISLIHTSAAKIESVSHENDLLKADRYLTIKEVIEYTGFGLRWVESRQAQIGYYQDGKEKRFRKSDIDAYLAKHRIQSRHK